MNDEDPELIYSSLCGTYVVDGVVLEVNIVSLKGQAGRSLEVVNEQGTSTTWDEVFISDGMAWKAFEQCVEEDGVAALVDYPEPNRTLH